MKLFKWHTLVFNCPCCGKGAEYAAQIVEGEYKGSYWAPTYWCERCSIAVRARDTWMYGAVFGPLMAMVAAFAIEALPPSWAIANWAAMAFAGACCAIVGWPLSRMLSRHLLQWEPREPAALQRARLRRLREDEK